MATSSELLAMAREHVYPNYRPAPIVLSRGRGWELFDVEGRRFLDLCAGVAVCSVGHAHPVLTQAIAKQASVLIHTSNYFYSDQSIRLSSELCARTRMDRAFLCNSGTEANEALLKMARRYF